MTTVKNVDVIRETVSQNDWSIIGSLLTRQSRHEALVNLADTMSFYGFELPDEEKAHVQERVNTYLGIREYFEGSLMGVFPDWACHLEPASDEI